MSYFAESIRLSAPPFLNELKSDPPASAARKDVTNAVGEWRVAMTLRTAILKLWQQSRGHCSTDENTVG